MLTPDNLFKNLANSGLFGYFFLLLSGFLMISCDNEDEFLIPMSDTPMLTLNRETVELSQKQANNPAVNFSWTRGSNRGTDAAIDYVLQIAQNENFENAYELQLGRVVYNHQFNNGVFNDLLLEEFGLTPGQAQNLKVRVKSDIAAESVEDEYSNVVTLNVTPYEPVSETLYLIGSAAPNGWDAGQATEMEDEASNPGVFTFTGNLNSGELKFITSLGEFLPSYNRGEAEGTLIYRTEDSQPDEKIVIDEPGVYTITTDLLDLTFAIDKLDQPPFSNLYIVGDASESGWNIDSPAAFAQSTSDPFVFTYEGMLAPGAFKVLAGNTGDWCGEWYRPLTEGQDLSSTEVDQNSGCEEDNKWQVTEANQGYYRITVNTREMSVSIEPVNLYLVGDAGPNGWNIGNPEPMTRNGAVYTYSGPLTAGEFKIAKFTGDWCDGEWINAATAAQPISNSEFIFTQGCEGPDNKWVVDNTSAGDYTITVDLANGTLKIE